MDLADNEFGPGKANRPEDAGYEQLCGHILTFMEREKSWVPYGGAGIGVRIPLNPGAVVLDIALRSPDGATLLIGECRGHARRLTQDNVFELKGKMDMVGRATGKAIEAVLFSSAGFQRGLVAVASPYRIRLAHVAKGQNPDGFAISFAAYDEVTGQAVTIGLGIGAGDGLNLSDEVRVELSPPRP